MKRTSPLKIPVIGIVGVIGIIILAVYIVGNKSFPKPEPLVAEPSPSADPVAAPAASDLPQLDYVESELRTPTGVVYIQHADTQEKEELGLGKRASLAADHGMLFYFDDPGVLEFWMKDMRFPLDIVWITADRKVAGVIHNLSEKSYPLTVASPGQVKYVLEIGAGAADRYGFATGTPLRF